MKPPLKPFLPGEELIQAGNGFTGIVRRAWENDCCAPWVVNEWLVSQRQGKHPAPRRQINADGTETPVWVWEADR